VLRKYDVTLPEEKIRASEDICKIIADVYSSVEREIYIGSAAERLKLPHDIVKNDVERIRRAKLKEYRAKESREALLSIKSVGDRINPDASKNVAAAAAEEVILGLLLIYDEYRTYVAAKKVELSTDDFFTDFGKRVFTKIMELHSSDEGYSYSMMGSFLSADEMGRLQKMIQARNSLRENGLDVLRQSVATLKSEREKYSAKKNEDVISGIESIIKRKSARGASDQNNT
jgi:DNA primase